MELRAYVSASHMPWHKDEQARGACASLDREQRLRGVRAPRGRAS